jgi:hypothetical protein
MEDRYDHISPYQSVVFPILSSHVASPFDVCMHCQIHPSQIICAQPEGAIEPRYDDDVAAYSDSGADDRITALPECKAVAVARGIVHGDVVSAIASIQHLARRSLLSRSRTCARVRIQKTRHMSEWLDTPQVTFPIQSYKCSSRGLYAGVSVCSCVRRREPVEGRSSGLISIGEGIRVCMAAPVEGGACGTLDI